MITIKCSRQEAEVILQHFFPVINLYKQTRLNNVSHMDRLSEQYLGAVIINSLLEETERIFRNKVYSSAIKKFTFNFTDAQAVVLYKSLMVLPIDSAKIYFVVLRNQWIEALDQSLISIGLYEHEKRSNGEVYSYSDFEQ